MTALVTKHLPLVADAPDGIKRLRGLILELAVQGKLTSQLESDEPAQTLLNKAREEKALSTPKGSARNGRSQEPATPPFLAPKGWVWTRKSDVLTFLNGYAFKSEWFTPDGIRLLRNVNIGHGLVDWAESARVSKERAAEFDAFSLRAGDVVLTLDRPIISTGLKVAVIRDEDLPCLLLQRVAKISAYAECVASEYLSVWLNSSYFIGAIDPGRSNGVPHISTTQVGNLLFALPPLAEQRRIVAKVDELMALCDRLETDQADAEAAHAQLVQALLHGLTQATDDTDFRASWQRLSEHFHILFTTEASIDALKQAVLKFAVMGKLVSFDADCDPLPGNFPPLAEEDAPFKIPRHWKWVRLGAMCDLVTSGSRGWKEFYAEAGSVFIRSQDIKTDQLAFDNKAFVRLPSATEGARTLVARNDLLITITGANVGKAAHITEEIDDAYVSQHVALVRPTEPRFSLFIHRWLINSYGGRALLLESSYGAKPGLNLQNIKDLPVPMPPLSEQHCIVAKVDELLILCDQLKVQLASSMPNSPKR